jgi:hypothetical protein
MEDDPQHPSGILPQGRILEDGTIIFPHRGQPPRPIIGYVQDSGDPFVFKPILPTCKYRVDKWRKMCGGMARFLDCSKFKIQITAKDCLACKDAEI